MFFMSLYLQKNQPKICPFCLSVYEKRLYVTTPNTREMS